MITEEQINKIKQQIIINSQPEKIILFGSCAHGSPNETSDLDLLIVVKDSLLNRIERTRELRKHLWGIINAPKDILVYTITEINRRKDIPQSFIHNVLKNGKTIYDRKNKPD